MPGQLSASSAYLEHLRREAVDDALVDAGERGDLLGGEEWQPHPLKHRFVVVTVLRTQPFCFAMGEVIRNALLQLGDGRSGDDREPSWQ